MNSGLTKVKLKASGHLALFSKASSVSALDLVGRIVIVGPPRPPESFIKCSTDLVWPIMDDAILREKDLLLFKGSVVVCRHQIEAAD